MHSQTPRPGYCHIDGKYDSRKLHRLLQLLTFVVPNTHVKKLQSIQNSLARIVTQTPRYIVCPITNSYKYPIITKTLRDWLPVWSRLHFKIILITYKAVTFQQPPSLWNLLEIREIPHYPRSTRGISLFRPFAQGFRTRFPKVWNVLPEIVHCAWSVLALLAFKYFFFFFFAVW